MTKPQGLTPRQVGCLSLIAQGKTSIEIAQELGLTRRTVDHYVGDACARLGVRSRAHAVAKAIAQELIPPHPLT
jgi:DNA-binding CsgD family transcriptional regulator